MNSIEIIDFFIAGHQKLVDSILKNTSSWDDTGKGNPKSLGESIASTHLELIKGLEFLKEVLLKEIKAPKCRHLKKDRDIDPKGNVYCVNCNSNLPEKMRPKLTTINKTTV
jgi:hypothetical protein